MRIIMLLVLVLFQACAAKKLVVEHADTFIETAVERRLPLYSAQKKALSLEVDKFLEKNKEIGRKIIPLIDQINLDDTSNLDEIYNEFLVQYKKVATNFSKIVAKHMSELDENQQKKLFENLNVENAQQLRKDALERSKAVENKVEKLIGSLSEGQSKFFNDQAAYFQDKAKAKIKRKEKLQSKLKEILAQDISSNTKEDQILEAFQTYQDETIESSRSNIPLVKQFVPTLTPKQKERFRDRMKDAKEMIGYYLEAAY
jgi:hypothetical protein